ncbi:right-handed parallel beta-helix repeat-containing protein [Butyrivibrio sp. AE3004]|uniref:right-handed parallel beta-helix repeat-containing protein n=1 Tax=Butyrivibrio sp. AE3004 TaxID=1506994 RepID=UPI000494BB56|nr:right-handed parallel beta-helix repeat-containing protein [Butyrivibrio sp. AE3004]
MRVKTKALSMLMAAVISVPAIGISAPAAVNVKAAGEFKPEDFGAKVNDGKGDRQAIKDALEKASEAGGGTVVFGDGTYDIDILDFSGTGIGIYVDKPNITFRFSKGTVLNVLPTKFDEFGAIDVRASGFCLEGNGGKIVGNRNGHSRVNSDEGHGISVKDCNNITITDVNITDCWGDGIYLGSSNSDGSLPGCSNINIKNCTVSNNRRNNIAIVAASNVVIDKCTIKKANGAAPQCGILIEPNTNGGNVPKNSVCKNITIKNTTITCKKKGDKNGQFFAFNILNPYFNSNNKVVAKTVKITNCTFKGDCGNYSGKGVVLNKCKIKGTFYDHKKTKVKKSKISDHYKF